MKLYKLSFTKNEIEALQEAIDICEMDLREANSGSKKSIEVLKSFKRIDKKIRKAINLKEVK